MAQLTDAVIHYGLPLIFVIVLLEQIGLPIPAMPILIVGGALAVDRDLSAPKILGIAVLASILADTLWYWLGRRQGRRVLKLLCKVSLSPDSCVRQTESVFERYGMPSLLFAKFIPGFSTVAPPLAGAVGATLLSFLLYDAGGALVWAGAGVGGGMIFHSAIDRVLDFLTTLGSGAIVLLAVALVIFVGAKWWQRRRFYQFLRTARISPSELWTLIQEGKEPVVLDVRTSAARLTDPRRLPGASVLATTDFDARLADLPRDREIILYCT
ncbi:MAG TPA: VTT domain-containing protein [Thermoanaerobaculia bacterium]|jgi:membrane protein DedA with SNARE-associated domain